MALSFRKKSRQNPSEPLAPKAAWARPFDKFLGDSLVSDKFAFDGRDEEYDHIWSEDIDIQIEPLWTSPEGYSIHVNAEDDWEPETIFLLAPDGSRCGFYSGGQCWIDEPHRGRGLAAEMVLAMSEAVQRSPTSHLTPMGFSEAGYAAHQSAWVRAVDRAQQAGLPVSPGILDEADCLRKPEGCAKP